MSTRPKKNTTTRAVINTKMSFKCPFGVYHRHTKSPGEKARGFNLVSWYLFVFKIFTLNCREQWKKAFQLTSLTILHKIGNMHCSGIALGVFQQ